MREVGVVTGLFRYPVKSMAGERLQEAIVGWHGLEGDRRYAFRREDAPGGFPWLSAGRLASLVLYRPQVRDGVDGAMTVATPAGATLELDGEALADELSAAFGSRVSLMRLDHGTFDDAKLSLITESTIGSLARECGRELDTRRFRPNVVVRTTAAGAFPEEGWVGARLRFGAEDAGPVMGVTQRDVRCAMIGLDPDTGAADPAILKTTVRVSDTCAGVYGAPLRTGRVRIGDPVFLLDA
jgi:uncharacterized protein YcbX